MQAAFGRQFAPRTPSQAALPRRDAARRGAVRSAQRPCRSVLERRAFVETVALDLAVQGRSVDAQDRAGLLLLPAGLVEDADQVLFLQLFQRYFRTTLEEFLAAGGHRPPGQDLR